jgi:hypothetical protein
MKLVTDNVERLATRCRLPVVDVNLLTMSDERFAAYERAHLANVDGLNRLLDDADRAPQFPRAARDDDYDADFGECDANGNG